MARASYTKIMYGYLFIIVVICFGASNSTSTSTSAGSVEYLPGFKGKLPFKMQTGYVGVDENEDVQLFYYFIQSESNPVQDPLMLWMSGGPGCSSISGLLYEIGPIQLETVKYNGSLPSLILTPNSWTKVSNKSGTTPLKPPIIIVSPLYFSFKRSLKDEESCPLANGVISGKYSQMPLS